MVSLVLISHPNYDIVCSLCHQKFELLYYFVFLLLPDGMYMKEVDRVLRPGGYWVLSGPPINWKTHYKAWQRPEEELREEQRKIEEIAKQLCWEKKSEKGEIAVWQKSLNDKSCRARKDSQPAICKIDEADDVW